MADLWRLGVPVFLAAGLMGWGSVQATIQTPPLQTQPDGPTVVSVTDAPAKSPIHYDLGETSLLDRREITHTFVLHNDGHTPLTLDEFIPSCHCTSAAIEKYGTTASIPADGTLPTLAPGQQAAVRVTIIAEPYLTGLLDKSVGVYAQGRTEPIATLEVSATLRPSVALTPAALDFGTVAAGQSRSLTLTADLDTRLLPGGTGTPSLVASDPDLQIVPVPTANVASVAAGSTWRTLTYRVTLAQDASLGPVRDLIRFAPSSGAASDLSLADGPSVPVTGEVAGAAAAAPASLAFGVVRQGRPSVRTLLLVSQAAVLPSATVRADSPHVTTHWGKTTSQGRALDVTLNGDAPAGSMQTQIVITLSNGQRLCIPITAYVSTAPLP